MKKQIVLACAGLDPDSRTPLCDHADECVHYEEWWTCDEKREWSMNLCNQAGGPLKMFTAWRPLIRAGVEFEFKQASAQRDLFA